MSKSIRIDADELLSCFNTLRERAWKEDAYEVAFSRGYLAAIRDAIHLVEYRKSVEERERNWEANEEYYEQNLQR